MKIGLVFNPTAGGGRTGHLVEALTLLLEERGAHVILRTSSRPGDATRLARDLAATVDAVVAAGGDGTVNEVVNGLVGGDVPLGILPAGTVNVLAKELDLPTDPAAACDVILGRSTVRLDTGVVRTRSQDGLPEDLTVRRLDGAPTDRSEPQPGGPATQDTSAPGDTDVRHLAAPLYEVGRRFVLMVGAGIDALTVRELDPRLKRRYGRVAFVVTGVRAFVGNRQPVFDVTVEGRAYPATFVVVGNSRYYGGRFGVTDRADPTDGLLDVMVFRGTGFASAAAFWLGTPVGLHLHHPAITYVRGRNVELKPREPGDVVWFQTDGELAGRLPASIEIEAQALRVLKPPRTRCDKED